MHPTYLGATDAREKIDDLAYINMLTLQDLTEHNYSKSYDEEATTQLRREITFENIIYNLIEFSDNKMPDNIGRISK